MTYTPDYILELKDGKKVELLFNSWAIKQCCIRKGLELGNLIQSLKDDDIPDYWLVGHEAYCKYNNLPFAANDLDAYMWVDEVGGYTSPIVTSFAPVLIMKVLGIDRDAYEKLLEEGRKIIDQDNKKKVSLLPSETSTKQGRKRA